MAPTVLLVGLLLLAQSDALCRWPAMAPDDKLRHSGFLKLQSEHVEQRCLSGTSPQWQFMLSVELCSLMGLFHRNGLSSFFFDNNVFFFPCQWFSLSRKKFKSKSRTQHYKRICISCQFVFQSLLPHIMCHFPIRCINPLYFIPFLIFLVECHLEYRTGRVFFSSQDSSIALGRTVSISWDATTTKNLLISDVHVISAKYLSSTV